MIIYEVDPSPIEGSPEGEPEEEYFSSRKAAIKRAEQLTAERLETPEDYSWCAVTVSKLKVRNLPKRRLVLAILNRKGWLDIPEKILDRDPDWFRREAAKKTN